MATIGEIVRVALHYTQDNAGDMMNVFHFRVSGDNTNDADFLDLLEDWCTDIWADQWKTLAAGACTLSHFEADIINTDGTVNRNIGGAILNIVGDIGGDVLPAAVSAYILGYTPLPKARGSKYVPGISESQSVGGEWNAGTLASLAVLLSRYVTIYIGTGGVGLVPGVLSLTLGSFIPFLVSGAIDTQAAYQRRRKEGVGI